MSATEEVNRPSNQTCAQWNANANEWLLFELIDFVLTICNNINNSNWGSSQVEGMTVIDRFIGCFELIDHAIFDSPICDCILKCPQVFHFHSETNDDKFRMEYTSGRDWLRLISVCVIIHLIQFNQIGEPQKQNRIRVNSCNQIACHRIEIIKREVHCVFFFEFPEQCMHIPNMKSTKKHFCSNMEGTSKNFVFYIELCHVSTHIKQEILKETYLLLCSVYLCGRNFYLINCTVQKRDFMILVESDGSHWYFMHVCLCRNKNNDNMSLAMVLTFNNVLGPWFIYRMAHKME